MGHLRVDVVAADLHEPREDRRADTVLLLALALEAALRELDLRRVEQAAELGHERAVERVGVARGARRRAVQHARELQSRLQDPERALCEAVFVFAVRDEDRGECRHVFREEEAGHRR